ncbi:hypothetical protein [Pseudomonas sp. 13B_3.2_Bac1]|uniref:hypothetical protein n=1 Tax=Pseudomonas sp. 13B_3.2_Bac1 TaxID=2971623 RepID=UPI0021C910CD|nr:hypothetical protein [Pseudomonas sp. 13B_3.2_Bac1]MCU1771286.1 hypothetical protein [Pseudomonas sp. 13B_3.2_Bac1]
MAGPTFTWIVNISVTLVAAWTFYELFSLIRQLTWNWIDDSNHPIKGSALLERLKKKAGVESDDVLEPSLIVAVCLMLWPVGLGIALVVVYFHRRRNARRLQKLDMANPTAH